MPRERTGSIDWGAYGVPLNFNGHEAVPGGAAPAAAAPQVAQPTLALQSKGTLAMVVVAAALLLLLLPRE